MGRRTKPPLSSLSLVAEPFNNKPVGGVNADRVEPLVTDGGKAVRCCRPDYDNVAGAGNNLFPIDDHCRLAGEHDTSFGIGMLMQSRALPCLKDANKEGNAGAIWLTFEF